ncbi:MAG: ABC transporter ATP-binding protein [Pseudomonadota bacterium]
MLEIDGLKKRFGLKQAVDGVSFTLNQGDVLGFLGPNGAGKTTTMRMIAGVLEPDEGDARIEGFSIVEQRRAAQRQLGYLPEGAPAYAEMTPRAFLAFIADARGLPGAARRDAIDRAVADARISTVLADRISALSKGYRRRVGLAAAILHDPPVLVLDEPTDGLDPNQKRAVRALIARMAATKAILISTHTLEEVPAMCSRVVIVDRGRVIADDTPEALAARGGDGGLERAFLDLTDQSEAEAA